MQPDLFSILLGAIAGAITSAIGGYISLRKLRSETRVLESTATKTDAETGKTDAEAAEIIGRTWSHIVTELRNELNTSRTEIAALKAAINSMQVEIDKRDIQRDKDRRLIRSLQKQVAALRAQLVDLGHEPYKIDETETLDNTEPND